MFKIVTACSRACGHARTRRFFCFQVVSIENVDARQLYRFESHTATSAKMSLFLHFSDRFCRVAFFFVRISVELLHDTTNPRPIQRKLIKPERTHAYRTAFEFKI